MKNSLKTKAFVVRKRDYLESDRILVLLTEDMGRVDVLVRGARKPGSRMGGVVDCYMYLDVEIEQKRGLDLLKDASLIEDCRLLEVSLSGLGLGGLMSEVVEILTYYDQDDKSIYRLYGDYITCYVRNKSVIDSKRKIELYASSFLMSVLALSGRIPVLDHCSVCGEEVEGESYMTEFGLCHMDCPIAGVNFGIVLEQEVLLMRSVLMSSCDELMKNSDAGDSSKVFAYFLSLYNLYQSKELKSLGFLNSVYKNLKKNET